MYFACLEGPQEVQPLTTLRARVGPLKKDFTRAGGGEESGRLNLLYFTCLDGSGRHLVYSIRCAPARRPS